MNRNLANLGMAVERLYDYLEHLDTDPDGPDRNTIMHMVHEVNNCYVEWAMEVDMYKATVVD